MARRFSYENVTQLAEGEKCLVATGTVASVRRKVAPYAARNNKRMAVEAHESGYVQVSRLPVTDAELPGVG